MNTRSRCGGCRFIRRKCTADCIFAPFFPSSDPERFVRVHRIFGATSATRMLRVPADVRAETAESIIYEADCRVKDPVYGCVGVITRLQEEITATKKAIAETRAMLAFQRGMIPKRDILGLHEEELKQPPRRLK